LLLSRADKKGATESNKKKGSGSDKIRVASPAPPPPPPSPPPLPPGASTQGQGNPPTRVRPLKANPLEPQSEAPIRAASPPRAQQAPIKGFPGNPKNEQPGTGNPGDAPTAAEVEATEGKGKAQLASYTSVLARGGPDSEIFKTKEEVDKATSNGHKAFLDVKSQPQYIYSSNPGKGSVVGDLENLKMFRTEDFGFPLTPNYLVTEIRITKSRDQPKAGANTNTNQDTPGNIVKMTVDPGGRFFVMQESYKKDNLDIGKIPLNEMVMQGFLNVAGAKSKNFKVMFITNIQNRLFWEITRKNYDATGHPFSHVVTFAKDTPEFNRYMGSDNINSKFFGFGNHHNALGNKRPVEIIIVPKQATEVRQKSPQPNSKAKAGQQSDTVTLQSVELSVALIFE
jgi:hypothetical protein